MSKDTGSTLVPFPTINSVALDGESIVQALAARQGSFPCMRVELCEALLKLLHLRLGHGEVRLDGDVRVCTITRGFVSHCTLIESIEFRPEWTHSFLQLLQLGSRPHDCQVQSTFAHHSDSYVELCFHLTKMSNDTGSTLVPFPTENSVALDGESIVQALATRRCAGLCVFVERRETLLELLHLALGHGEVRHDGDVRVLGGSRRFLGMIATHGDFWSVCLPH